MPKEISDLFSLYESVSSEKVHSKWIDKQDFSNKVVLDIGCGSGRDANYIASKGAKIVIASDKSSEMITLAKSKHKSPKIKWVVDSLPSLTNLKKQNLKKFDFIICSAVLMFLNKKDQEKSISRILSLLSSGGKAVISVKEDINDERIFRVDDSIFHCLRESLFYLMITNDNADSLGRNQVKWKIYTLIKREY
ncbi:class I SAM-dependent methyltransferase [Marinomonas shanghaiensis]|uniref:class I SAM-dependent methyltransferase n=1 Tax=Marinomonas shanghaiensis TaxID=2202418 RepID=UPI003A90C49C